jgi:glycosyltransferase involved in cell wall biosynthesis
MKAKSSPLVSVIIPSYNGSQVIWHAIQGVLKQTYNNYEIIVVDDGSTDSTLEVLERYTAKICLIRQQNLGCMAARQRGVEHAKGEYLAFLDQDDWWIPEKLSIQVKVLQNHSNVGLAFGNLEAVDDNGNSLGFMVVPPQCYYSPSWRDMLPKPSRKGAWPR